MNWPKNLPVVLLKTFACTNRSAGYSLFELTYGTNLQTVHNTTGALKLVEPLNIPANNALFKELGKKA